MHWLKQQIHQAARFRLLDVAESFFDSVGPAQAELDEIFIDFELIVEERDLQFFPVQVSSKGFQNVASTTV